MLRIKFGSIEDDKPSHYRVVRRNAPAGGSGRKEIVTKSLAPDPDPGLCRLFAPEQGTTRQDEVLYVIPEMVVELDPALWKTQVAATKFAIQAGCALLA